MSRDPNCKTCVNGTVKAFDGASRIIDCPDCWLDPEEDD